MELEEMKNLWQEMSAGLQSQQKINDDLILRMTKMEYRKKLNNIFLPEAISTVISFAGVIGVLFYFQKLDTWYLLSCGIVSVLILVLLPVLSLRAICRMRSLNVSKNNLKESLLRYSKGRMQFVWVQKMSFYLGALLLVFFLPVAGKLISGKDFFTETHIWIWYAIMFPFFYGFARPVYKYYLRASADAENILKELDTD